MTDTEEVLVHVIRCSVKAAGSLQLISSVGTIITARRAPSGRNSLAPRLSILIFSFITLVYHALFANHGRLVTVCVRRVPNLRDKSLSRSHVHAPLHISA